jgi:glucokinase
MDTYIAADVGGTQIRVAVFPAEGTKPLIQKKIATKARGEKAEDRLAGLIAELIPSGSHVRGIAVAAPGFLDPRAGLIISAVNIPGWQMLPLKQILQERFAVPVALGNDANLAALGEWKYGAGQGHHHLLYLTVSTGIGGGVIIDDRLLEGSRGLAGEFGHIVVEPGGPLCGCGQRGHLEAVAAGPGMARWVSQQIAEGASSSLTNIPNPTGKDIYQAAAAGDTLAVAAFARSGRTIGRAIADFLHLFNPSIIILGGGVSMAGELLFSPLREAMREAVISPEYLNGLQIVPAALGDDCGLLGALALTRAQS